MATRSVIARLDNNGIKAIYCHNDGYLSNNGKILDQHYADENKVDKLLKLGSLSYLRDDIETQNNFKTFPIRGNEIELKDVTMAYHRDRGDDLEINEFSNLETMLDYFDKSWGDYLYLFENVWLVKNDDNDFFMEVKEVLNENS